MKLDLEKNSGGWSYIHLAYFCGSGGLLKRNNKFYNYVGGRESFYRASHLQSSEGPFYSELIFK